MIRDPNRPPATGPEWNGSRASDVPVEPGGTPNPLEAKKSNDDPPFDFAPPEDIPIDDDVCVDEWMAEAPDEPPTGNGHDPDPADAGTLEPDRDALVLFVDTMFKNADTRGYVSLRAFRDNDKRDEKPILIEAIRLNDPDFAAILFERARQAATSDDPAVFCPPVTTFQNHQNAKTDNIFEGVDLSTECDQLPLLARHRLEALLGTATVVVESGGEWMNPETGEIEPKVHLHWRLKVPTRNRAEHELLKEARTLATNLVGGDKTNKSVVHPIRWPGSWHRKKTPRLAKIVASSGNEIDLNDALEILREASGTAAFTSFAFDFNKTGGKKLEAADHAAVASALSVIPNGTDPKVHDWEYWNWIGMATWAATGGSEIGRVAFHEWSAKSPKNNKETTESRWQHYKTSPPTKIGFGTLVYLARQHSPGWTYGNADEEPEEEPERATVILDGIKLDENADWTRPEGLLGTITDWIMLTSRRPNRPLAVASAVAVLSAVCGRHLYGPTGTALNVYIVCLAGTAMGKDRPLSAPGAILAAANLHRLHTTAKGFSVSALEQMMVDHPCCVATVDEIGASLFARMSHKHASTHEQGMRSVLLELWSRDQFKGPFSTTRHAVQKGSPKVPGSVSIPRPNLTLFGVSTPEAFYAAVTAGSVKDGFLNRFLTCHAAPRGKAQEVSEADGKVPEEIVKAIRKLVPVLSPLKNIVAGGEAIFSLDAPLDGVIRRLPWGSEDVRKRAEELEEQILVAMDGDPETAPLLGRVFEYSIRLASLHAVSREGLTAAVSMADLSWGASWVIQSARAMVESVAGLMASTEYETKFNLVRNLIKEAGQIGRRKLLRKVRSINARERDDIIRHLVEGGWIEEVQVKSKGRTAQGWKWL